MSTRAYILLRVKECDLNTSLIFDKNMLDKGIDLKCQKPWNEINYEEEPVEFYLPTMPDDYFKPTRKIIKPFLAIYCHYDNYPTGTGSVLLQHFNDYDKAKNLMAGGFVSGIYENRIIYSKPLREPYYAYPKKKDNKKFDKPEQYSEPSPCEAYQYLFYDGRWFVRQWGTKWYELQELLETRGEDADENLALMEEYLHIKSDFSDEEKDTVMEMFENKWNNMLPVDDNVVHLR